MRLPFRRGSSRTTLKTPDDRMTLTEHLGELRTRIIRSALAVVVGAIFIIAFYDQVLDLLMRPYRNLCERRGIEFCDPTLITLDPIEGFSTRLRVATYGGLILALPVVLWQIWKFIVPALHANEKRYAVPFVLSSVVLFIAGGLLAYLTLDKALEWLIGWAGEDVVSTYQVSRYIRFVGLMVAAFGIGFEFPVLLVFLQLVGVLSPQTLLRQWRYAIVAIAALAAVITPSGDPITMSLLAVPMSILYLVAVGIGIVVQRRRRAQQPAD